MGLTAYLSRFKVFILTLTVIVSFIVSSLGWHHFEASEFAMVLVAGLIMISMYILMIFELVNRNLAALIGAAASVAAYDCMVKQVELTDIVQWEDLETLALLFGMMVIVNVLSCSGLFNFLAIWSYKQSKGRFWLLITIMSFITAFLSAFMDNVSTMLLMSPTLIKLSELEHVDPRYILMIMVLFCNIGGCGTPVGDPPNLIIIGDKLVSSIAITFGSFVAYCGPCVLLTIATILIYLRIRYNSKESFRMANHKPAKEDNSIKVTSRNPDEDVDVSLLIGKLADELILMQSFQDHLNNSSTNDVLLQNGSSSKLRNELEIRIVSIESNLAELKQRQFHSLVSNWQGDTRRSSRLTDTEISQLMKTYSIKNKSILIQSLAVLIITILLFFLQSLPGTNLTLGWISLFAGLTLLVMSSSTKLNIHQNENNHDEDHDDDNFEFVINNIEWSTLIFFFALFIVMEVMSKLGLISFMGHQITNLVDLIPAGQMRSIGTITIILWASGIASACIDNVPFTSMMIKILGTVVERSSRSISVDGGGNEELATVLKPLVFALAFGACYGGNGSLIGASANLITAGVATRHGYPITFNGFFRFAAPVTLISLLVANVYLIFVFVIIGL